MRIAGTFGADLSATAMAALMNDMKHASSIVYAYAAVIVDSLIAIGQSWSWATTHQQLHRIVSVN